MGSTRTRWRKGLAVCVAVFALGAVTASAASATEYVYKVKGATLGTGVTREVTSKATKTFVFEGQAGGHKALAECGKEKLNAAAHPVIVGGTPGRGEKQTIEFEECVGIVEGSLCGNVAMPQLPTTTELVTIVAPAAKAGQIATLITIAEPKIVKWQECGGFPEYGSFIGGTTAARVNPEKTEQAATSLIWKAGAEQITKIKKSNGSEQKVELTGEAARSIEGQAELRLVSGESWGVF
jgi:hypothetical protein